MRYSFKVWAQEATWEQLRDIWVEADRAGFWDMVWLNDHLYPPKSSEDLPIMDAWTLFGGLAAVTDRLRFGTMVSANTFRHPVILAKQAVTLDHMSDGRLEIGVGTGWHEGEHQRFGIDLPPLKERFEMLDETFTIIDGLMRNEVYSFDGKHRTITDAHFEPKPIQQPRPPFVIGGTGPKKTIPLAAKWADQWNFPDYTTDPGLFSDRLAQLHAACEEIGRDPDEIEVSVQFRYSGDPVQAKDLADAYRDLGADHILVSFSPPADPALPVLLAETLAGR